MAIRKFLPLTTRLRRLIFDQEGPFDFTDGMRICVECAIRNNYTTLRQVQLNDQYTIMDKLLAQCHQLTHIEMDSFHKMDGALISDLLHNTTKIESLYLNHHTAYINTILLELSTSTLTRLVLDSQTWPNLVQYESCAVYKSIKNLKCLELGPASNNLMRKRDVRRLFEALFIGNSSSVGGIVHQLTSLERLSIVLGHTDDMSEENTPIIDHGSSDTLVVSDQLRELTISVTLRLPTIVLSPIQYRFKNLEQLTTPDLTIAELGVLFKYSPKLVTLNVDKILELPQPIESVTTRCLLFYYFMSNVGICRRPVDPVEISYKTLRFEFYLERYNKLDSVNGITSTDFSGSPTTGRI